MKCAARFYVAPRTVAAIACIIAAIASTACGRKSEAASADTPPAADGVIVLDSGSPKLAAIDVDTVRVTHERAVAMLPAQLALDENHTVRVFSPVTGRVRTLLADPGTRVAAGAPLARIASGDMAQATSDQAKAEAALVQTSAALTRAEDLFAHKVIALKDLEQARSDAAQARAESERARQRTAQLGGTENAAGSPASNGSPGSPSSPGSTGPPGASGVRGDFVLRSPIDGIVIDRTVNEGAEVRPDATVPLFTVSSLDTLWLIAAAPQRDLEKLHTGAHLAFTTDAAPGRTFDARVTYVGDQLDPVTRTAVVRAAIANHDRGLRAMTVGVARLMAGDASSHVVIPTRALVTRGTEVVVFVELARGHFERRPVIVDDDDGTIATIREGLKSGERVVTRGSILLAAEAERLP
jgi:cobalt-zinc-cadmium efflux system membrane fusion protein